MEQDLCEYNDEAQIALNAIKLDKCPILSSKIGQVSFQNPNFMGISGCESCVMSVDLPDDFIILDIEDNDKSLDDNSSYYEDSLPI